MVVMNNLLPSAIKMHEKYDLKGSTYKRKVGYIDSCLGMSRTTVGCRRSGPSLRCLDWCVLF